MLEVVAELPMLVLIFTRVAADDHGSLSGWLMLAGRTARPGQSHHAHIQGDMGIDAQLLAVHVLADSHIPISGVMMPALV